MAFVKATKKKSKLRMAITGPSGSGKTFTSLRIAKGLGEKIALIGSEYGSAEKYADLFEFDVNDISANTHPHEYVKAINEAIAAGYDVVVIDSMTHAWDSTKKEVDRIARASNSGNSFVAWNKGTEIWNTIRDRINSSPIHVIVTMRSKTEYVQDVDKNGKKVVRKVGLAPEVRDGSEYEYDAVLDMNHEHFGSISKTRCNEIADYSEEKPGEELGKILRFWLESGIEPTAKPQATEANRPDFVAYIQGAGAKLKGFDAINKIVNDCGYSSIDKVQPKDFHDIMKKVKDLIK